MLSLTLIMEGDVNIPTNMSDARSMDSTIAQTEPFPSEPATCTVRIPTCGSPSLCRSSSMFSSPGLTPLPFKLSNQYLFPSWSNTISDGQSATPFIWVDPW